MHQRQMDHGCPAAVCWPGPLERAARGSWPSAPSILDHSQPSTMASALSARVAIARRPVAIQVNCGACATSLPRWRPRTGLMGPAVHLRGATASCSVPLSLSWCRVQSVADLAVSRPAAGQGPPRHARPAHDRARHGGESGSAAGQPATRPSMPQPAHTITHGPPRARLPVFSFCRTSLRCWRTCAASLPSSWALTLRRQEGGGAGGGRTGGTRAAVPGGLRGQG